MRIAAIIAEYNPFHNGHAYLAEKVRQETKADYVIALMSGDYVQRGTPAALDRYTRAKMALTSGIDLVISYPTRFAASSAESFAENAIRLLNGLGCIDILSFGSECGDLLRLQETAGLLLNESSDFQAKIKENLKKGLSYPTARARALEKNEDLLSSPNNILAIEYLKALKKTNSSMKPFTIARKGAGYHNESLNDTLSSASALRLIMENISIGDSYGMLGKAIPENALSVLKNHLSLYPVITEDDLTLFLGERLCTCRNVKDLTAYRDINEDIAGSILNKENNFKSFSSFAEMLKSKTFTRTRLNRALLELALDLKDYKNLNNGLFAHVLGFRKDAHDLPGLIKDKATLPVLLRVAKEASDLSGPAADLFEEEMRVSSLYELLLSQKSEQPIRPELSRGLITI